MAKFYCVQGFKLVKKLWESIQILTKISVRIMWILPNHSLHLPAFHKNQPEFLYFYCWDSLQNPHRPSVEDVGENTLQD